MVESQRKYLENGILASLCGHLLMDSVIFDWPQTRNGEGFGWYLLVSQLWHLWLASYSTLIRSLHWSFLWKAIRVSILDFQFSSLLKSHFGDKLWLLAQNLPLWQTRIQQGCCWGGQDDHSLDFLPYLELASKSSQVNSDWSRILILPSYWSELSWSTTPDLSTWRMSKGS